VTVIPASAGIQARRYGGMEKQFAVYIMASQRNGTIYIGVTSNLPKRVWEHREGVVEGFTTRYAVKNLVWYELHDNAESAITREKQLKKWNRAWKLSLIEGCNPTWKDRFDEIC
jgi:putative endonuclease